jgi:hypothetical protein
MKFQPRAQKFATAPDGTAVKPRGHDYPWGRVQIIANSADRINWRRTAVLVSKTAPKISAGLRLFMFGAPPLRHDFAWPLWW